MHDETANSHEPVGALPLRLTAAIDVLLGIATAVIILAWVSGHPLFYTPDAPVLSPFTAFSLFLMVSVRQARIHIGTWPMALSLAVTGLVLGGNISSAVMLATMPPELFKGFPEIVLTSVMTSIGLVLFCAYDLVIALRETPESAFAVDDMLIHLALVPGSLSLLGYLLGNPTYLSAHADPRVGISPVEMVLMALYATSAVISNRRLFLWRFLAAGWTNRFIFAGLFLNQFAAPFLVALVFSPRGTSGPGLELFVMLAGVVTTLFFLTLQARLHRRKSGQENAGSQAEG